MDDIKGKLRKIRDESFNPPRPIFTVLALPQDIGVDEPGFKITPYSTSSFEEKYGRHLALTIITHSGGNIQTALKQIGSSAENSLFSLSQHYYAVICNEERTRSYYMTWQVNEKRKVIYLKKEGTPSWLYFTRDEFVWQKESEVPLDLLLEEGLLRSLRSQSEETKDYLSAIGDAIVVAYEMARRGLREPPFKGAKTMGYLFPLLNSKLAPFLLIRVAQEDPSKKIRGHILPLYLDHEELQIIRGLKKVSTQLGENE